MILGWHVFVGLLPIGVGIFWVVHGKAPVGVEGSPPSYYLTGRKPRAAGLVAIAVGIAHRVRRAQLIRLPSMCVGWPARAGYQAR